MSWANVRRAAVGAGTVAACLSLFGCGGEGTKGKAEKMARNELSIYPLSSAVECVEVPASGSTHRWSCTAQATGGGGTQQVAVLIQCVDGATVCTRVS